MAELKVVFSVSLPLNEDGVRCYETENITPRIRGTSQSYKLAKLKRDFGSKEVMDAITENGGEEPTHRGEHC